MEEKFNNLIEKIRIYNPEEVEIVTKAYEFAKSHHNGQFRKSGEPYIIHPIEVVNILADMHADRDTLCAGFLHDVIEDCGVAKEEIAREFNSKVAELVDGVTNFSKVDFQNSTSRKIENKKKIILGIINDARIVIIKLADRLHNMRTLQYQKTEKQKEIAEETLHFYVRLARYIGAEKLRRELEDLSFFYIDSNAFLETQKKIKDYTDKKDIYIGFMKEIMSYALDDHGIKALLEYRIKNIYTIYCKLCAGEFIENIHDLLAIKVLTREIKDCYYALGVVHNLYAPCNSTFKDYICRPKANMYSSLHSSVIGLDETLTQIQIRTIDMEKINMYGLTAYWDICKGEAGDKMHEILRDKFHFEQSVKSINNLFADSEFFVNNIEQQLLGENINVYDYDGYLVSLPEGATVVDFAYHLGRRFGDKMVGAFVNGVPVELGTTLHNGDRVHIMTSEERQGPSESWLVKANYIETQRAIRKSLKKENL